jgi:hypothetical protein
MSDDKEKAGGWCGVVRDLASKGELATELDRAIAAVARYIGAEDRAFGGECAADLVNEGLARVLESDRNERRGDIPLWMHLRNLAAERVRVLRRAAARAIVLDHIDDEGTSEGDEVEARLQYDARLADVANAAHQRRKLAAAAGLAAARDPVLIQVLDAMTAGAETAHEIARAVGLTVSQAKAARQRLARMARRERTQGAMAS